MKLYHGSAKELEVIKPSRPHSARNEFERMEAVFLTKTFLHSALYALGSNLKGQTKYGVSKNKLVIKGHCKLAAGYVYHVDVENPIEGPNDQYAYKGELKPSRKWEVKQKEFEKHIFYVENENKIIEKLTE
ncbi:MAG: hypothetical protein ABEK17_03285 [Candidatus Aenigmatarchaeota archaeon]